MTSRPVQGQHNNCQAISDTGWPCNAVSNGTFCLPHQHLGDRPRLIERVTQRRHRQLADRRKQLLAPAPVTKGISVRLDQAARPAHTFEHNTTDDERAQAADALAELRASIARRRS